MLPGISKVLLAAKSVVGTVSAAVKVGKLGLVDTTHYITWGDGAISGEVTIESASKAGYTGTWAPIAVVTFTSDGPKEDYVRVQGAYGALRHRISSPVSGGTVTTKIVGSV